MCHAVSIIVKRNLETSLTAPIAKWYWSHLYIQCAQRVSGSILANEKNICVIYKYLSCLSLCVFCAYDFNIWETFLDTRIRFFSAEVVSNVINIKIPADIRQTAGQQRPLSVQSRFEHSSPCQFSVGWRFRIPIFESRFTSGCISDVFK